MKAIYFTANTPLTIIGSLLSTRVPRFSDFLNFRQIFSLRYHVIRFSFGHSWPDLRSPCLFLRSWHLQEAHFKYFVTSLWVCVSVRGILRWERESPEKRQHFHHLLARVPGYGNICQAAQIQFSHLLPYSILWKEIQMTTHAKGARTTESSASVTFTSRPPYLFDSNLFFPIHVDTWLFVYIIRVRRISVLKFG